MRINHLMLNILCLLLLFSSSNILCDDPEMKEIAKNISENLETFSWKKIIGFNYSNYYVKKIGKRSEKEETSLFIYNITPFISMSKEEPTYIINDEEEKSITFKNFSLNYKFDLCLEYSFLNREPLQIIRKNIFAEQKGSNIIFVREDNNVKFNLKSYSTNDIKLLTKLDLLETKLIKENEQIFLKTMNELLESSLKSYLNNVIFYYPNNSKQRKIYNMVKYLIKGTFSFIIRVYGFYLLDYKDISFFIDENYNMIDIVCTIDYWTQVAVVELDRHIFIKSVEITDKSVKLSEYTTDFPLYIESRFTEALESCFDSAFSETDSN